MKAPSKGGAFFIHIRKIIRKIFGKCFCIAYLSGMTLKETVEIILKWVKSCETSEQVNLLENASTQWTDPFKKNMPVFEFELSMLALKIAIDDQKLVVNKPTETGVPTLDLHNQRHDSKD